MQGDELSPSGNGDPRGKQRGDTVTNVFGKVTGSNVKMNLAGNYTRKERLKITGEKVNYGQQIGKTELGDDWMW